MISRWYLTRCREGPESDDCCSYKKSQILRGTQREKDHVRMGAGKRYFISFSSGTSRPFEACSPGNGRRTSVQVETCRSSAGLRMTQWLSHFILLTKAHTFHPFSESYFEVRGGKTGILGDLLTQANDTIDHTWLQNTKHSLIFCGISGHFFPWDT